MKKHQTKVQHMRASEQSFHVISALFGSAAAPFIDPVGIHIGALSLDL